MKKNTKFTFPPHKEAPPKSSLPSARRVAPGGWFPCLGLLVAVVALPASAHAGDPPVIVQEPQSIMVPIGETLRLSCVVTGTPPIAYIWQRDGVFLGDQTNATLTISNAQPAHSGRYRLTASNEDGLARSTNADVVVFTNQPCNFPWAWEAKLRGPREPSYATWLSDMALDAAGNIFVTGQAGTIESGSDFLTARYAPDGRLLWTASFVEPSNQGSSARAMAVDWQGACYVTGYGHVLRTAMDGDNDYVTIKYDGEGQAIWTNHWDAAPRSADMAYAIAVDDAGQSYILGTGGLLKLSATGTPLWSNTVCRGDWVMLKLQGDALYAASDKSAVSESRLFKLDTNGVVQWVREFSPSRNIRDMTTDLAGCVYTAAAINYNWEQNTGDIEVAKLDGTGSNVWTAVYDGPFGRADDARALAVDRAGAVFVTGWTWHTNRARTDAYDRGPDDVLTLKFNANGSLAWAVADQGPEGWGEYGSRIAVDDEGSIYVAGGASLSTPQGSEAIPKLLKYEPSGNLLWASTYRNHPTGTEGSSYSRLALGKPGQVVVAGWTSYWLPGHYLRLQFLVASYDELTPRLHLAGVPAPSVRQGCLVSPRWTVFDMLATTNLQTGDWQRIGTVTNFNGLVPYYDRDAGQYPVRFYRARTAGQ